MFNLLRKLTAEFLGTFAFVFVGAGSICTDAYLVSTGQSGLGWLGIAIAAGLSFGVMASVLAHISGGHLNPAITIGFNSATPANLPAPSSAGAPENPRPGDGDRARSPSVPTWATDALMLVAAAPPPWDCGLLV